MKSAIRRHHYKRLKKNRSGYWYGREIPLSVKHSGMVIATPKPCGGLCCGNPRRVFNQVTIQEKRNFQEDK